MSHSKRDHGRDYLRGRRVQKDRSIDNMKRAIVVVATTLILTAGQALAEGALVK
jgi:hypothetical protein